MGVSQGLGTSGRLSPERREIAIVGATRTSRWSTVGKALRGTISDPVA